MKVNDRWVGFGPGDPTPTRRFELPPTITGSDTTVREFSAVADCPACGCLDIHWLAEPRRKPVYDDSPTGQALRMINETRSVMSMFCMGIDDYGSGRYVAQRRYEPPEATVGRICKKCSFQWGQG